MEAPSGTASQLPLSIFLYGVSFTDANTGTVVGYENPDGMILRTTDGGNSWVRQNSGLNDPFDGINFFGVRFVNSNVGTIVGDDGIILRTTDGGSNWVQQTSDTTDLLYAVHFSDENHGAAVGFLNGTVHRTTDGGQSWGPQNTQATGLLGVYFIDANAGDGRWQRWCDIKNHRRRPNLDAANKRNNQSAPSGLVRRRQHRHSCRRPRYHSTELQMADRPGLVRSVAYLRSF